MISFGMLYIYEIIKAEVLIITLSFGEFFIFKIGLSTELYLLNILNRFIHKRLDAIEG